MIRFLSGGLVWACLAPVFYAVMSASVKLAGGHLSVWQIGLGRFGLGLLVIPPIVKMLGLNLWGSHRVLLSVRGLCGSIAFLLLVASLQRIPLSVALIIFYLYPAFTALLSPWVTGEPASRTAWLLIGCAFAGIVLILSPSDASTGIDVGHLLAGIASVLCALTLLLVRRLGKTNNIYTLFFYLCLTGTLACVIPLIFQQAPIVPIGTAAWLGVAAVALFSIGAQLSINQALMSIATPKVSVMMTAEVPLVAAFGVIYLGEPVSWRLVAGALLIFGSGVGLSILPDKSSGN